MIIINNIRNISFKIISTITISSCLCSWWYRPVIDQKNGLGLKRIGWISQFDYQNIHCKKPPLLYQLTSNIITFIVVSASWIYLYCGGKYQIIDDENYQFFLEMIKNRDHDTPIITISNHRSLLDDPLILSALLPFWMNCQHKYLRWGACAQEICFQEEHLLSSFIGVGKSLPMWRGGGLDQPLLLQFARKTVGNPEQPAEWIHVYPEAGVYQYQYHLGGRRENKDEIGKLKWGIGKLIAHHPTYQRNNRLIVENESSRLNNENNKLENQKQLKGPLVIPFYFIGTEAITPFTDVITRKVKYTLPQFGQNVTVRFGKPIYFHDLLDEFESNELKNGKVQNIDDALRVYHCCGNPLSHNQQNQMITSNNSNNYDESNVEYIFNIFHNTLNCSIYIVQKTIEKIIQKEDCIKIKNNNSDYNLNSNNIDINLISKKSMYNLDTWKSTSSEKKLYHKITSRIENELEKLGEQCASDVKLLNPSQ